MASKSAPAPAFLTLAGAYSAYSADTTGIGGPSIGTASVTLTSIEEELDQLRAPPVNLGGV